MQYYQKSIALGSITGLCLISDETKDKVKLLFQELWRDIYSFERNFSRFIPGSELSLFNRNAGSKVSISPQFRSILLAAKKLSLQTNGLFNPFFLPELHKVGYVYSRVPGHEMDHVDNYSDRSVVSINQLEIDRTWAKIPNNPALDIGGFGKGYLADQLKAKLEGKVNGYWLSLGGDILVSGLNDQKMPWTVAIENCEVNQKPVGYVKVMKQVGVATSATTVIKGDGWHHIIDPRTLEPSNSDILQATIVDKSLMKADAFATCAIVLNSSEALNFLKSNNISAALLQSKSGKILHYGNAIILYDKHA